MVGAGTAGRRPARRHRWLRSRQSRHQGQACQRAVFGHPRSGRGGSRVRHAERRGRPRWRVGQRARQAGRDCVDGPPDGRDEVRPLTDGRHHQSRRQELRVPAGVVRVPGVRQRRHGEGGRRRQTAVHASRVRRRSEEDDPRRQEPVRMVAAALPASSQWRPERRDVVGVGSAAGR